jgi:hypothetical protein
MPDQTYTIECSLTAHDQRGDQSGWVTAYSITADQYAGLESSPAPGPHPAYAFAAAIHSHTGELIADKWISDDAAFALLGDTANALIPRLRAKWGEIEGYTEDQQ